MPNERQNSSSLRSVALVTGLALVQLLVQFAMQLVLARLFGAASDMDAFVAALAPPVVIATILSGSLGYVLVPIVAERMAAGDDRQATAVASQIGLYLLAVSLLATVAVAGGARPLAATMCPGFDPPQQALTADLLRVLALLIVANSLVAFLNALHHCQQRFLLPAVAGVIGTAVTLGYVILLFSRQGIFAVAWGTVAGAAITTAILLPRFVAHLRQPLARQLAPHPAAWRALALLAPLVLGALYWRLDPLVDRWLGSFLAAGSIAHLGYAWRLTMALMMIGTSGLSIVAFPALAAHAAARRWPSVNAELAHALRLLAFLLIPVCLGLGLFAEPVVKLLFERGKFTAADSHAVAGLLVLYLGVVLGASVGDLLSRTLYALHDTRTPVVVSVVAFTLAVGLKVLLVRQTALAGLAAATSVFYLLNAGALAAILLRRLGRDMLAGVGASVVRCAASASIACLVAWLAGRIWMPLAVFPAMAAGAASYLLATWLLSDEFAVQLGKYLWKPRSQHNA